MSLRALILFGTLTAVGMASEPVEFSAYIRIDGVERFVLREPAGGGNSDWLVRGGSFNDYRIESFDAKTETLTVSKAQQTYTLPLRAGTVQAAKTDSRPAMVHVVGSVRESNKFPLPENGRKLTVVDAIALAGRASRVARLDRVMVSRVRKDGERIMIQVDVGAMMKNPALARGFLVEPGDTIFVPENII